MMKHVLIMNIEDQEDVWKVVEKCQLIFHPEIAPNGVFDKEKFWRKKARKPFMLVLDRNLFSALIHICEKGKLKDEKEQQLIGFIMTWAAMNGVNISSGNAVMEYATSVSNQEQAEIEIGKFLKIIDFYPVQMWFSLASGERESLPVCNFDGIKAENITAQYSEGCDSFMNALAATIHMVVLFRDRNISKYDKMMHFFEWVYDYSQVSNDVLTYAILMLTNQEGVKAPKGANKEKYEDVLKGCENQAWDLSYIMNIKRLHAHESEYAEDFLFATNDTLLKRIIVNANSEYSIDELLYTVFSQKEHDKLIEYLKGRMRNRSNPNYSIQYYKELVEKEKKLLCGCVNGKPIQTVSEEN